MSKKLTIRRANKYLSDDNPSYLSDKDKLFSVLVGNGHKVPELFYDLEIHLKSKRKRDDVLYYARLFADNKLKKKEVLDLLKDETKKKFKPLGAWIIRKR